MKNYMLFLIWIAACFTLQAQSNEVAMSLELNTSKRGMTQAQIDQLESRIINAFRQADVTVLGGGTEILIRASAQLDEGKTVDTGMKKLYSQSVSLTLNAGTTYSDLNFNSMQIDLRGSGKDRNAAISQAIRQVKPQQTSIARFIKEAKEEALKYYDDHCEEILARTLPMDSEALGLLSSVPQVSTCHDRASEAAFKAYIAMQGLDCEKTLAAAKAKFAANAYEEGLEILTRIDPESHCFPKANTLFEEVASEVDNNQKQMWETHRQLIANAKELEVLRLKNLQERRRLRWGR